jgi:hypothetical protein
MKKQDLRTSLIECIEAELNKDPRNIDGDLIDRGIDTLYALESRSPPKLSDEALDAAARTIRSRAAWRRGNTRVRREQKHRFTRRVLRGALAACCVLLFLFSANYVTIMLTGSCLFSRAGVKFCCGTSYCVCDIAKAGEESLSHTEKR